MFGNDRATGEIAEDMFDAAVKMIEQVSTQNTQTETDFHGESQFINHDDFNVERSESSCIDEEQAENSSANANSPNEPSHMTGKKRKAKNSNNDPSMVELLKNLCRTTGDRLETIARRIAYDRDVSEKRSKVYGLFKDVHGLTPIKKFDVTHIIGAKVEILEIFMGLPEDARALYALRLLEKESG